MTAKEVKSEGTTSGWIGTGAATETAGGLTLKELKRGGADG